MLITAFASSLAIIVVVSVVRAQIWKAPEQSMSDFWLRQNTYDAGKGGY